MTLFTTPGGNQLVEVGLIALLFGLVCVPNGIVWALFGTAIARFLDDDRHRRIFNIVMARAAGRLGGADAVRVGAVRRN